MVPTWWYLLDGTHSMVPSQWYLLDSTFSNVPFAAETIRAGPNLSLGILLDGRRLTNARKQAVPVGELSLFQFTFLSSRRERLSSYLCAVAFRRRAPTKSTNQKQLLKATKSFNFS